MLLVNKKKALITGAGSPIAKSIINTFGFFYEFYKHKFSPSLGFLHGNLAEDKACVELSSKITELDLLVCCSGGIKGLVEKPDPDNCIDISSEEARCIFDRNFFSVFLTCKYIMPKMKYLSNVIIIGSSIVSKPRTNGELAIYSCSKSAVHEYSIHLANQMRDKIKVNCIITDGKDLVKINNSIKFILRSNVSGELIDAIQ